MPAAYTHIFVANTVLHQLKSAAAIDEEYVAVNLPVGSSVVQSISVKKALVKILIDEADSFRAGAIGPDFFPDVFVGITISHQPCLKKRSLNDFMKSLANSIESKEPKHIAFAFGWLSHICADVFGHHWVGMESGGDFQTWLSTPPEVIRVHLGMEKLWDEELRKHLPQGLDTFAVDSAYIRQLSLTDGSPLCDTFYNDPESAHLFALIQLCKLAKWHGSQEHGLRMFREHLLEKSYLAHLQSKCPLCRGTAEIQQAITENCPSCKAVGEITAKGHENCPLCKAAGVVKENCPECKAVGKIEEAIKGCKLCRGSGKIACAACGGDGRIRRLGVSVPCPACVGQGGVKCPHNAGEIVLKTVKKTCPKCNGGKLVKNVCKRCGGNKVIETLVKSTCPQCNGAKLIQSIQKSTCPVCAASIIKTIDAICDRLIRYHQRRTSLAYRTVDSYIEAHGLVARSILDGKFSEVRNSFDEFFDNLQDFQRTETSFIDLVAPEIKDLDDRTRKLVDEATKDLKELIPKWAVELTKELFAKVLSTLAEWAGVKLTDSEIKHFRKVWASYASLDQFPPLANGINLFLLTLDRCDADLSGAAHASRLLGSADNIDKRCQPFSILPFTDSGMHWEGLFQPFVDKVASLNHCKTEGFKTTRD